MEASVVADDAVRLWVHVSGRGVPLVMCHGGPGVADYLGPVEAMVDDLALVYRWDQRGSGRSEQRGPYTIDCFVRDLEAIRGWAGHDRWLLLGHSWGANLAVYYARAHPERVAGIIYRGGTGIEWSPHFSAEHKRVQRERLAPVEADRLEQLGGVARTPAEQSEYDLPYLLTEFGRRGDARGLAQRVLVDRRFPTNLDANALLNAEMKSLRLADQQQLCGEDPRPGAVDRLPSGSSPDGSERLSGGRAAKQSKDVDPRVGTLPWREQPEALATALRGFIEDVVDRSR